jgi:hypothetical protein
MTTIETAKGPASAGPFADPPNPQGRRARVPSFAVLALAALALVACGGGSDSVPAPPGASSQDTEQIEATATRFARAVADRDVRAFCGLLAPSAVARLASGGINGRKRCPVVWGPGQNPLFAAKHPGLQLEKIIQVKGPSATARLADGGRLVFLREGGAWYVNLAPATKREP